MRIPHLLLLAVSLTAPHLSGEPPATSGAAGCRFIVPVDLAPGPAEWIGPCAGGKADGTGVIRVPHGGTAAAFYGSLHAGMPVSGVIQNSPGDLLIVAHTFDAEGRNTSGNSYEMSQSIQLFDLAAKAARVAAQHYRKLGNQASAAYYSESAHALEEQFNH